MASRRRAMLAAAELALIEYASGRGTQDDVYRAAMLDAAERALAKSSADEQIVYKLEYAQRHSAERAAIESNMSRSSYYRARYRLSMRVADELLR